MFQKNIPIFFTFNDDYVVPAAVAFFSLLNRAKKDVFYHMFVLHHDITIQSQKLLQSVVGRFSNASLSFYDTQNFLGEKWVRGNFEDNNKNNKFTVDAVVRCFSSKFFPQYKKIIYSDVDVVFTDDISELWEIELEDSYIAGVRNFAMKYHSIELSHLKPEHYNVLKDTYIAGGIWVLNLEKIREDNLESKMQEILEDETIIKRWNDQDIMNIACNNKVKHIPLNYIAYPYMLSHLQLPDFVSHYSQEELWDSIINPKIIHYADQKPWKANVRYSDLWWDIFYYLNLPKTHIFEESDSYLDKRINKYKNQRNIYIYLFIFSLFLFIISLATN